MGMTRGKIWCRFFGKRITCYPDDTSWFLNIHNWQNVPYFKVSFWYSNAGIYLDAMRKHAGRKLWSSLLCLNTFLWIFSYFKIKFILKSKVAQWLPLMSGFLSRPPGPVWLIFVFGSWYKVWTSIFILIALEKIQRLEDPTYGTRVNFCKPYNG